ncbi:MAG: hypothetical protein ACRDT4_06745 [Micromonosporaceae bacterium]
MTGIPGHLLKAPLRAGRTAAVRATSGSASDAIGQSMNGLPQQHWSTAPGRTTR